MASQTSTKASQIGWMFVPQYYTFVNKDPARLHCFYTKRSTLIHGVEGEDSQPCYGQQEIHEKIMSLGFEDCKVFVSTVDSQSSAEGGIIVQVVGELSNKGGPWRKFAQTFFLAEQPNGYFVLNDIFRYIKEESDEDETALAEEGTAAAASSTTQHQQQEVTYDQLANAAIVGDHQQDSSSSGPGAAATAHDFELAQQHGAPGDAAGVTVAPPQQANQEQTRASLEGLVNGQVEQQQVVELHDDLQEQQVQQPASGASASANDSKEVSSSSAAVAQVNGTAESTSVVPIEVEAPSSAADPAAAIAEAQQAGETSSPAAPAQTQASTSTTSSTSASTPAAAPVQETSKPAAPKSWASLAAAGQGKWRSAVVSSTAGVTSSVPASSSGASRSTTPAAKPSDKAEGTTNNTKGDRSERNQQQQQQRSGGKNSETRTPNFTNVETGFSIVVSNITENMSHGLLRQRLSDEFAQLHGSRKEWAKLSYLDIDRRKGVAYVDFEEEWALKKAIEKGSCEIEGTVVEITGGKGGRRDASGLGTGRAPQSGGKGKGDQGQKGQSSSGAGPSAGKGGAQRNQRGGRGANDKQQ